ncbi:hypothetical protein ACHAWF_008589 [Thalassiosira exigua]
MPRLLVHPDTEAEAKVEVEVEVEGDDGNAVAKSVGGDEGDARAAAVVEEAAIDGAAAAAAVAVAFADAGVLPDLGAPAQGDAAENDAKIKKKRMCKFPGCVRTVKAQGHCQRHGAKTKRCKAPGCKSQAQGSHEGYCKRHWREFAAPEDQRKSPKKVPVEERQICVPVGPSVYDGIIPASFQWKNGGGKAKDMSKPKDGSVELVPILQYLVDNEHLDTGWHRSKERLARGVWPPKSLSIQLETWEKQLAILEMALIAGSDTGGLSMHRISKILAHAWGREKGFHKIMIIKHCQRRGDLDRKKRVDASVPRGKRAEMKAKLEATQGTKKRKLQDGAPGGETTIKDVEETMIGPDALEQVVQVPVAEDAEEPPHKVDPPPMEEPSIEEMVTEYI